MEHYTTIARYTYPGDYAVLELLLQRDEIRYVFLNETVINILPFHSNAFGGIRLQVHKDDVDSAKMLIKNLGGNSSLHIV